MKGNTLQRLIGSVRRNVAAQQHDDRALLERYREQGDLEAFDALIRKHGGFVLTACHRVLTAEADVEDVFQATFLVLINNPHRVRKEMALGSWLYGVAHRLALQLIATRRRRERLAKQAVQRPPEATDVTLNEACRILHEELDQLPDQYRHVLMLCYLEGKSRDEAATCLGWTLNEVRGALERGRERLRIRLEKRGVSLSVGLLAIVGNSVLAGVPSSHLIERTLGTPSPAIAELARGGFPMLKWTPLALTAVLMMLVGLFGIGLLSEGIHAGPAKKDEPPKAETTKTEPAPEDSADSVEFKGIVQSAAGMPVVGAKVFLLYYTVHRDPIPERATTDAEGKYRFTIKKSAFRTDYRPTPWNEAFIVAQAAGHGLGWSMDRSGFVQLAEAGDLTGRILNLEGQPVAGVTVRIVGMQKPTTGNLDAWTKELSTTQVALPAERKFLVGFQGTWIGADIGTLLPMGTTDKEGRFRIPNIGSDRVLELIVSGPSVETRTFRAITRKHPQMLADEWERTDKMMPGRKVFYVGNDFELIMNHGRTIHGVVKDAKTGKPILGAKVHEYHLANDPQNYASVPRRPVTTDADGKFTLHGIPVKGRNVLLASAPKGQPYLLQQKSVPTVEGFGPATVDFELTQGTVVTINAIDKATRQPVKGTPSYFTLAKNEYPRKIPGFAHPELEVIESNVEGNRFNVVVPPGPGLIAFRSAVQNRYMMALGVEQFKDAMERGQHLIDTRPYYVHTTNYNNLVRIDPKPDDATLTVTVELDAGRSLKGNVLIPEGKAKPKALVYQGLNPTVSIGGDSQTLSSTAFTVTGLLAGQERMVVVRWPEEQLTGCVRTMAEQKNPVEVKLVPWATLKGRALDVDGKPLANMKIGFFQSFEDADPVAVGSLPNEFTTDADGKFHIMGLTPGMHYRIGLVRNNRLVMYFTEEATFKAGEHRDLGDMKAPENP